MPLGSGTAPANSAWQPKPAVAGGGLVSVSGAAKAPAAPKAPAKPKVAAGNPLSSAEIASFDARKTSLGEQYKLAIAQKARQDGQIRTDYARNVNSLGFQRNRAEFDLRSQLAGRGVARDPMFAGQGIADINTAWNTATQEALADRESRLDALRRMVEQAELNNTQGKRAIENEKLVRQASLADMYRKVGGIR